MPTPLIKVMPALPATSRVPRRTERPALLTTCFAAGALALAASLALAAASAAALAAARPATAEPAASFLVASAVAGAALILARSSSIFNFLVASFVCLPTSRRGLVKSCMSRFICQLAYAIQ